MGSTRGSAIRRGLVAVLLAVAAAMPDVPVPALAEAQTASAPARTQLANLPADWPAYRGSGDNVTDAPVPTQTAEPSWVQRVYARQGAMDMSGVSEPILVGGRVFVAVGSRLEARSASTGEVEATAELVAPIDTTCRMTYAAGVIVVPLHSGALQALAPDRLDTVWVAPSVEGTGQDSSQQSLSTLTVSDGCVIAGTSNAGKTSGYLRCVRLSDGAVVWASASEGSGYYWCGAAATSHGLVIARNSGELDLVGAGSGEVLASVALPSPVSSSVVAPDDDTAYVMGYDGTLYKVAVGDGSLSVEATARLCAYSISTPTVAGGRVYVGGSRGDSMRGGGLYVLDAETLEVQQEVTTLGDRSLIQGPVASSPLVAERDGGTYAYFTANGSDGAVLCYRLGDSFARRLFAPEADAQDYCLSSVVPDAGGALYYVNDSGNLFKLVGGGAGTDERPPAPETPTAGRQAGTVGDVNPSGTGSGVGQDEARPAVRPSSAGVGRGTAASTAPTVATGAAALRGAASPVQGANPAGEADGTSPLWMLDGAASDSLSGAAAGDAALPGSSITGSGGDGDAPRLPLWPAIGMAVAAVALVLALAWRRLSGNGEA